MLATPDANVLNTCRTLFGTEAAGSPEPLLSLKPNVLKAAFRKKAKETHPDLFTTNDPHVQKLQAKMFRVVNEAYDIMRKYGKDGRQPYSTQRTISLCHRGRLESFVNLPSCPLNRNVFRTSVRSCR